MAYDYASYVPILKALSDETRLKVIDMLSCGEMCACDLLKAFSITQSTLSHHMKILVSCGIVQARRDGAWMRYTLNSEASENLISFLRDISSENSECICRTLNCNTCTIE